MELIWNGTWNVECGMWNDINMTCIQHIYKPDTCCLLTQMKGGIEAEAKLFKTKLS